MAAGQTIGKAYVQIMPSVRGLGDNLRTAMGGEASSAGDAAGSSFGTGMVGKIKGIIAAAGIGTALKLSLDAGGELQQSLGGVETLFKENADTVKEYANQAYRTAGMSANEYMETVTGFSASLLQSLGGDTAKAAESADMALTDMSDNANKFGTDMESIKNAYSGFAKQNYTMLDNLKLGYGGTKAEMERLLADAQKISGVEYDIKSLDDVYQAIHVIQGELGVTGTTAKEASETLAGSAASMKAAFTNVLGKLSIGEDISADLNALADSIQVFLFGNVLPMVGNVATRIPQLVDAASSMIIKGLNMAIQNADGIAETVVGIVTSLAETVVAAAPYLVEAVVKIVSELASQLLNMDWGETIAGMLENMRLNLELASGEILGTDGSIVNSVISAISEHLPELLENGVRIVTEIVNGIMTNMPALIEGGGQLIQTLLTTVLELLPDIMQAGFEMASNLASGLVENGPAVLAAIADVLMNLIETVIEHLPAILEKGREILSNVAQGIIENLPELVGAVTEVVAGFIAEIASHLPEILETGIKLLGELIAGIINSIPDVVSAAGDIISNIVDAFSGYDWGSIGINLISGIGEGIAGAAEDLASAAVGAVGRAWEAMTGWLDIRSPSHKAEKGIGRFWAMGVGKGFVNNFPAEEMLGSVKTAFVAIQNEMLGNPVSNYVSDPGEFAISSDPVSIQSTDARVEEIIAAINELKQAIMTLRIIMDSGEVVGAIIDLINEELGKEADRIEWQ